ncbi:MAG: hypothetical protein GYB31_18230 [Bacteroidetes bacterium]|nr:hypothetical protein [Bacteroidota bacterium]
MICAPWKYLIFVSLSCLVLAACTEEPPPTLGPKDIKIVDSLYQEQVLLLKPEMDSICDLRQDSILRRAVDSMLTQREEEIKKQLERIRNQQ